MCAENFNGSGVELRIKNTKKSSKLTKHNTIEIDGQRRKMKIGDNNFLIFLGKIITG